MKTNKLILDSTRLETKNNSTLRFSKSSGSIRLRLICKKEYGMTDFILLDQLQVKRFGIIHLNLERNEKLIKLFQDYTIFPNDILIKGETWDEGTQQFVEMFSVELRPIAYAMYSFSAFNYEFSSTRRLNYTLAVSLPEQKDVNNFEIENIYQVN